MTGIYKTSRQTWLLTLLLALLLPLAGWAQGSETFTNLPLTGSSYSASGSYTGDGGVTWNYTNSRGDQTITGKAITLRNTTGSTVFNTAVPGGLASLSFNYARPFSTSVNATVAVNGTSVGTITTSSAGTQSFSVSGLTFTGNVSISITVNSGGGQTTIDDIVWTGYTAPNNPLPTITSLAPNSANAGAAAQTITITGTGFVTASVANFNGASRTTTFVSATEITIDLTAADLSTAGAKNITVTNPAPGGGTSAAATFTVNPASANNPVPVIGSLSPSSVTAGAAAQTLTINGTGFQSTSTVTFNGSSRTPTFVSNIELSISLTAADLAAAGTRNVIVTNQTPGGGASNTATFTVNPQPVPTLTSISPSSIVGGSTTTVTFTGTNFFSGATVNFNGISVATTFVSSTSLTADIVAPTGMATATYPVSVTTTGGTSGTQSLTVTVPPSFFEDFETGTKGSYNAGTVTLSSGDYTFDDALLTNATGSDRGNGRSARVRGFVAMNFDKTGGAGTVTVSAAVFGSDTGGELTVEYSTNGGTSYTVAGSSQALTTTLTAYSFVVNAGGNVRLRLSKSGTGGDRINLDDLSITDFSAGPMITVTPTSLTLGSTVTGTASVPAQSYDVSGTDLTTGLSVTAPANTQVSLSSGSGYATTLTLPAPGGTLATTTIYVRIAASAPAGSVSGNITNASMGATTRNVAVSGTVTAAPTVAVLTTTAATAITTTTATTGGDISSNGGSAVTARGVVYGTTANPRLGGMGTTTVADATGGSGSYTSMLMGLLPSTTYFVAAYATNGAGTSYGADVTFTTQAPPPSVSIAAVNTAYTQDFNTLAATGTGTKATLPSGFDFAETGSGGNTYSASTGSSSSGDTYSFGDAGIAERAFGTLQSGSSTSTIGAAYTNNTGTTITSLLISYTGEQWRLGTTGRVDRLDFQYSTTATAVGSGTYTDFDALDFIAPKTTGATGALNGNLAANRTAVSATITGLSIPAGTTFYIQWEDFDTSGAEDGLGIDDLSVTANPVMTTTSLTVASGQNLTASGPYTTITVQNGGTLTLTGPTSASGAVSLQTGGLLITNCQTLSGGGSFTTQAGSELRICAADGISLSGLTGAIQVTGARSFAADASYTYNGTVAQVTGAGLPTTVRNLTVNNAAGLSLSTSQSIRQVLRLQSGNLNTSGQSLMLLSDANGTALVDNSGGVVNGTGTMQRAITSAFTSAGYRHFSAPVSNTTLNDLTTPGFAPTFNTAYNTSPTPGLVSPFPTVFGYEQARVGTVASNYPAFDQGFLSPTAGSDAMVPTRGYTVNVAATTTPIDFVGTFNNAAQNSGALVRGANAQSGWQLLGNPYPSPLDWSTVSAAQRPGMDAAMYVYQSTGQYAGTYRSYANGVGTEPLIDAGSGYFARVSVAGTPGAVNLTNANRVTTFGAQPAFGRGQADTRPQIQLALQGANLSDDAYVYFEAGATAGFDPQYDATKLTNPSGLNLSSVIAGPQELAINGLPVLSSTAALRVPLNIGVPVLGNYTLRVSKLENFTSAVTLVDNATGTRTVLSAGTTFTVAMPTSYTAVGQFELEFAPAAPLGVSASALAAQLSVYPNPASASFRVLLPVQRTATAVELTLTNALGQTVTQRSLRTAAGQALDTEVDVRGLATGVYALRLNVGGTLITRKVVVE